jgi:metal-dependent hydrolase (beta-lactamase superfamily II)
MKEGRKMTSRSFDKEMFEADYFEGHGRVSTLLKIGESSHAMLFDTSEEADAFCNKMNEMIGFQEPKTDWDEFARLTA